MKTKKTTTLLAMAVLSFLVAEKIVVAQMTPGTPPQIGPLFDDCMIAIDYPICDVEFKEDTEIKCRKKNGKQECGFKNARCRCEFTRSSGIRCPLDGMVISVETKDCPEIGTCTVFPEDDLSDVCEVYPNPELYTDDLMFSNKAQGYLINK